MNKLEKHKNRLGYNICLDNLKGIKIRLEKQFEQLIFQDKCFKLGLKWSDGTNEHRELGNPLMYIDNNLVMRHCVLYKQFNNLVDYKEVNLEYIQGLNIKT